MKRRLLLTALTLLLAAVVAGWIAYVPPAALDPMNAVPLHATTVYSGDAVNWALLQALPATRDLLAGFDPRTDMPGALRGLFNGPVTVASVPIGGRDRRDTLVLVSAAGWRAVILRWRLELVPPPGVGRLRSYSVWPVWQLDHPDFPAWKRVRFTLTDGLFIASISDNSHDIYYLIDTVDGRLPSMAGREGL